MHSYERLLLNATTIDAEGQQLDNQAVAIDQGRIVWCGNCADLPAEFLQQTYQIEDCQGQLLTPGLVDCHTHLVYAGDRADEFKRRLEGETYAEIARSGGGILSTVRNTRAASEEELLQQSLPRILALRAEGVTTLEIKSGYGLDLDSELKMLRVARRLAKLSGLRVRTTFLGAHAIPPEYKDNSQAYVDFLCFEMLPRVAESGLADAVDVFCESIAFNLKQTEQLFLNAKELGLAIKCHAEQLSNLGASQLAAKMGALSCDHLEHLDEAGARAMAESGTVAVLLPGAYYFLRETIKPPIDLLREKGVGIAIATDSNPGSSPTTSLLLMMNMACQLFQLRVPEVLAAVTYQGAKALGLEQETGSIKVGLNADLVLWSVYDSASLCYHFGFPLPHRTMVAGEWLLTS
ncbi:Imidazolonepropionase [Legionella massiliensis]|uniref:Imidazolonepropionase n=1 Tax=Legionella massiliensis TaxID=1034943 RepID=A0A078KWV9_9GAMM|nr:imidazolonepropionase [Legionella massiliensis]CDZ77436.1 Imidazolonepropionase [Legionella massiliensis]CEE13174.1 Imidazolonepropionase [Legionella massiliensis]